jgi:hypothetical protein
MAPKAPNRARSTGPLRRLSRLLPTAALALALGALGVPAQAASFDPDLTWRTMETPHFNITFHGGLEQIAEETALVAEDIWAEMTAELQTVPNRRTEIVLVDNTDSANGYAMTLPVNTIVIYVTAPEENSTLGTYEDWNDAILTHEFTHILHIDMVEGLPKALRYVFGRVISVNRVSPGWIVEGHATLQETRHTNGGRGRSTYVDMIKRMVVIEDMFPPLGNLDGWQSAWPTGNLRYLFGQDFQQYIVNTKGEQVWTDFFHTYGGSVPWFLPAKAVFGERFVPLYWDWKAHMGARYAMQQARVEAIGLTDFELLSDGEDWCAAPTYSPDGTQLVWACSDMRTGSGIFIADGEGANVELLLDQRFADDFAWRNDGEAFAFSSLHIVDRFNSWYDAYLWQGGESVTALSNGERARNPAFSPDGRDLMVVTNQAQGNQLARLTVDRRTESLTDYTDHTQLSSPRFTPDGRHVALSAWRAGQRDIWIADSDGTMVRRVTQDQATDVDPWWSSDGATLYFASDRTGIYNIYAVDLATERLWQVTNVLGGAFSPSVNADETTMVFESYSGNGMDIAKMPLDRAVWLDRGVLPMPLDAARPLADIKPDADFIGVEPGTREPPDDTQKPAWWRVWDSDRDKLWDRRPMTAEAAALVDPYLRPGLDGPGEPFAAARGLPGPWGRPGEVPGAGEMPADAPDAGVDVDAPTRSDQEAPEEQDYDFTYPVDRYNPIPSLLPPRYLVPYGGFTALGLRGGLATGGVDVMRHWLYSASIAQRLVPIENAEEAATKTLPYTSDLAFTDWSASLAYNHFVPVLSFGVSRYTAPYNNIYTLTEPPADGGTYIPSIESTDARYWDRRIRVTGQVSYPIDQYQSVFGRWTGLSRQPHQDLPVGTYTPFLPSRGFFSSIGGGWSFVRGKSFSRSISPESSRVVTVAGQLEHPALGSFQIDDYGERQPFTRLQATAEWRQYETAPWIPNHVIAWKLAAGASLGDQLNYGSFRLGGDFGESAALSLPDEWRALRGFPAATVSGDWYYLGSLEYRFPIWTIDRGVGVIPAFARNISAAVFLDTGNAFAEAADLQTAASGTLVGTGAELQARAIFLWAVPMTLRVGYGFALRGPGYPIGDAGGLYTWLGTSF